MAVSNGSIPVHSKVRYFRCFSIIRHTRSINILQNALKCTISTFSAEINNAIFELKIHRNALPRTHCHWGSLQRSPDPTATGGEGARCPLPKPHLKEVVHPCST